MPEHRAVSFREALRVWLRIGMLGFGGPAGQIALMHRILVDEKRWVGEQRFLHALNYCMLLPGPEAQQLAIYIGWLLHRTAGGLAAGILFVLPGAILILILSILYAAYQQQPAVAALFFGVKAAVVAVVIEALVRIGKRALKNRFMIGLALAAFMAIFFFNTPFPVVILTAALIGAAGVRLDPEIFTQAVPAGHAAQDRARTLLQDDGSPQPTPSLVRAIRITAVSLLLWFAPVLGFALWQGSGSIFVTQALFYSKMAMVTFGGAYAVLAYVAQQAVEYYAWLDAHQMLDGLGLAETTPGPLILVLQFVGYLSAYRQPGLLDPVLAGVLGAMLTTWVTFVPSFFWIFRGAPRSKPCGVKHGLTQRLARSRQQSRASSPASLSGLVYTSFLALFRKRMSMASGCMNPYGKALNRLRRCWRWRQWPPCCVSESGWSRPWPSARCWGWPIFILCAAI